jgi:putative oxidoreductase
MDLAMAVLRIVVGVLFIGHGAQKLFGAFGGAGLDATADTFENIGLRPGRVHAYAAGLTELSGGLLLALGLFVPFAAAALIGVMTAAIVAVHARNGLWVTENGFEYNLVMIAAAVALAGAGPGSWSIDSVFGFDTAGAGWALAALAAGLLGGCMAVLTGYQIPPERTTSGRPRHDPLPHH